MTTPHGISATGTTASEADASRAADASPSPAALHSPEAAMPQGWSWRLSLAQTGLLIQWQMRRSLAYLPLMVVVQVLLATATIVGFGFLAGDLTPEAALFLATGAPTITLVTVGLVMTPQEVANGKREGSLAWLHTLPVPRGVFLLADLTMWTLIALPGLVLAVFVGIWHYDLALSPAPWLPFALLAVSLTAASFGYALAVLLPPQVAMLASQLLVFGILLFTPVSFPAERMPDWAQAVHSVLPFEPMAQAVRAGLAADAFEVPLRAVVVLALWCTVSIAAAVWSLTRRR